MKSKRSDIIFSSKQLFNREGYLSPGVDRISEYAGVSKMTFYRYFSDKEALIKVILEEKHHEFIRDVKGKVDKEGTVKEKLFSVFEYYEWWFNDAEFNGCMFTRALFELGNNDNDIGDIITRFKTALTDLIRDILNDCLKPEPAERVALIISMLIDGAIAATQMQGTYVRENPPAYLAWMASKAIIYSEGGRL